MGRTLGGQRAGRTLGGKRAGKTLGGQRAGKTLGGSASGEDIGGSARESVASTPKQGNSVLSDFLLKLEDFMIT